MKKYDVVIDVEAENDIFAIYTYIAINDSVEKADKVYDALRKTCNKLKTLPLRGHIPSELFDIGVVEFRELYYKPYRVFYSIDSNIVSIHCVIDGRRDIQTILQERLLR
jgi:toxin ParE1/3/4